MESEPPSSTCKLLHSQGSVGSKTYSPCPRDYTSNKHYGTISVVNDRTGYRTLNDNKETSDEGPDQVNDPVTNTDGSNFRMFHQKVKKRSGLALTVIAIFFYAFHTLCVDFLTTDLNPFQISVMIFPVPLLGSLLLILCKCISPVCNLKVILLHLVSGISLFFSVSCITFSYEYIPLGDAVSMCFVSLVLVGILSWMFLREPLGLYDLSLAFTALAGVVFIARPSFIFGSSDEKHSKSNTLLGAVFGLGTAFSSSVMMVSVRKLSKLGVHSLLTLFVNDLIVLIFNDAVCLATGNWQPAGLTSWLWCLGGGTAYFFGQITFYIALSTESATLVNIVGTLQIVLSFLLEFLFFRIVPLWTSAIGGGLIMLASVGAVVKKPVDD